MKCFAHIINLIVQEGLKYASMSVDRVRVVVSFLLDLTVGHGVPTFVDWENVRRIVKILQPLYDLTLKVSGSLHVTAHCSWETLIKIHCLLDKWLNSDDLDIVSMASKMKDKYNKCWGYATNMNFLVYLAIILDPRRNMGFTGFG
ncbi:hypothetical protein V6N13_025431 [Hibiscus sabdariffa]